jgi:signal transduction histidine kinase/FixJ family two-component response regulator/purine-cytosine permease-like protein
MATDQQIFPVRRNYNQWVANQTLEDYSLRFTAKSARRWSSGQVAITAIGAISFLALEAIGGSLTLHYGFTNTVTAIFVACITLFLLGLPVCYHAAKHGIDIDLLTRGAGFGYIGSTITSLIYASFTFIFFAIEAAIMSMALKLTMGIPLSIGYVISSIIVIPLVTHGITLISRFQLWTQPLWIVLQILPLAFILYHDMPLIKQWTHHEVSGVSDGSFDIILFGLASSVIFSLVAQIGEQVDFLRFLPEKKLNPTKWKIAMLAAGPGWVVIGIIKLLIGSFLAWLAFSRGLPSQDASDPTSMYQVAFSYLTTSSNGILVLVGVFVIVSQLKINVTNAYAGSIAWSNFFSRVTRNHPGRVVWLIFNVIIALLLMELGIYRFLEDTLSFYAIIALAWMGSLVADLVISLPLGLRPEKIDFKRSTLYDINPVGVGSMLISTAVGACAYSGLMGDIAAAMSCYITLLVSFIAAPTIAWLTKGRYYIARHDSEIVTSSSTLECCICELHFENEDMSFCPAYNDPICSLCCSLDSRCHDACKKNSRYSEQLASFFSTFMPKNWSQHINSKLGNFLGMMFFSLFIIASLLSLIYFQATFESNVDKLPLQSALWKSSFILIIIAGVLSWIFVLIHDSHRVAQDETQRQTRLLQAEIYAHTETDLKLQKAKEIAESANQAKNRYLSGISHELRSPLNSLLGYAQLLEKDQQLSEKTRESVTIIRHSGEFLADLIEGLLDISKIEAGKLDVIPSEINFPALLDQIVSMFRLQADQKNIKFIYECNRSIPKYVRADEKHLRQILINLLSNAIKYTPAGEVRFTISYKNEIATFVIEDTGYGIDPIDQDRIFNPFEQIRNANAPYIQGTGLGLTITKLLIEIMGGEITLSSQLNKGSKFCVRLLMGSVTQLKEQLVSEDIIDGYKGERKLLMVVDDDPMQRKMMKEALEPLGFIVVTASQGSECLDLLEFHMPDLFILDISMPGMTGFQLAQHLRNKNINTPIIFISANAQESGETKGQKYDENNYIVKPVNINLLFKKIGDNLEIDWSHRKNLISTNKETLTPEDYPSKSDLLTLSSMAKVNYVEGISKKLEQLEQDKLASSLFLRKTRKLLKNHKFNEMIQLLDR